MSKFRKSERKKRRRRPLLTAAILVLLLAACAAGGVRLEMAGFTREGARVTVEPGDGTIAIAERLKEQGIIRSSLLFRAAAKFAKDDGGWQSGTFDLPGKSSYAAIRECLRGVPEEVMRVTVPEGKQAKQIARILEENGVCSAEAFTEACRSVRFDEDYLEGIDTADRKGGLEGYLFPDTYYFEKDSDPEVVIRKMLARFREKIATEEYRARAAELGYTLDQVVILASIVESEATTKADRETVADVFERRLVDPDYGYLQSCVTVEYAKDMKKAVITLEDTEFDSPYNTYKYPGLPYGPICCPGEESVRAVLWPRENRYFYFQSDDAGNLYFAETFGEHMKVQEDVQEDWEGDMHAKIEN